MEFWNQNSIFLLCNKKLIIEWCIQFLIFKEVQCWIQCQLNVKNGVSNQNSIFLLYSKIENWIVHSIFILKKVQCWRNKFEIKLQFFFCAVKIENWIMYSIYNFLRKCNVEFVLERCVLIFNAVENGLAETYMHQMGYI